MSNLVVYYHVFLDSIKYKLWVKEQLELINECGLSEDAIVNVNVAYHDLAMFDECRSYIMKQYPWVSTVTGSIEPKARRAAGKKKEGVTLKLIHEHAKNHPDDKILYIHTKGISRPHTDDQLFPSNDKKPWVYSWRQAMNNQLITNYKTCVNDLDSHDTVGVKWKDRPVPHYSGNFWWANASWINKLEDPCSDLRYWRWGRFSCEFWVCGAYVKPPVKTAPRKCKPKLIKGVFKKYPYSINP